jgi:hypothetical protein
MENREQFLKDVLTTAVEGGIQYWANVRIYHPDRVELDDDGGNPHTVTTKTISHGISLARRVGLKSLSGDDYVKEWWLADNGEDGDYDADIADQILQLGLFEKVVYG